MPHCPTSGRDRTNVLQVTAPVMFLAITQTQLFQRQTSQEARESVRNTNFSQIKVLQVKHVLQVDTSAPVMLRQLLKFSSLKRQTSQKAQGSVKNTSGT